MKKTLLTLIVLLTLFAPASAYRSRFETKYVDARGATHIATIIVWDNGDQSVISDVIISENND